jgi:hypothetical protein
VLSEFFWQSFPVKENLVEFTLGKNLQKVTNFLGEKNQKNSRKFFLMTTDVEI